ncbi:hypothetical protein C351_01765, partial [Cryptococcus neoformans c8]
ARVACGDYILREG